MSLLDVLSCLGLTTNIDSVTRRVKFIEGYRNYSNQILTNPRAFRSVQIKNTCRRQLKCDYVTQRLKFILVRVETTRINEEILIFNIFSFPTVFLFIGSLKMVLQGERLYKSEIFLLRVAKSWHCKGNGYTKAKYFFLGPLKVGIARGTVIQKWDISS